MNFRSGMTGRPKLVEAHESVLRISRRVKSRRDLYPLAEKLRSPEWDGLIKRKSLGSMAVTVFQGDSYWLPPTIDEEEGSIKDYIAEYVPYLFKHVVASVNGIRPFGHGVDNRSFVGLTFAEGYLHQHERSIKALLRGVDITAVRPEMVQPHLSLGLAYSRERAQSMQSALRPVIPPSLVLLPATVELISR